MVVSGRHPKCRFLTNLYLGKQVVSPQSSWSQTSLSASWSDSIPSSKHSSLVSSPPSTPFKTEGDAWDLLNAAAGEVGRLQLNEDRKPVPKQLRAPVSVVPEMAKQCSRAPQQTTAWRTLPHLVQLSTPSNYNVGSRPSGPAPAPKDRVATGGANSNVQKGGSRPREEERKAPNNGLVSTCLSRFFMECLLLTSWPRAQDLYSFRHFVLGMVF